MKINSRHVAIFLLLILLSVGFGFGFDAAATAIEKHRYPIDQTLSDAVCEASELYEIPQPILWATLRTGSGFASNAVSEDGRIGLMQLTPDEFAFICVSVMGGEAKDAGMLYDPTTNLTAGCAYLAYLYQYYGVWKHAFAAYRAGVETVNGWLENPENLSEQGVLITIPDQGVAAYVQSLEEAVDCYDRLYDF